MSASKASVLIVASSQTHLESMRAAIDAEICTCFLTTSLDEAQIQIRTSRYSSLVMEYDFNLNEGLDLLQYAKRDFGVPTLLFSALSPEWMTQSINQAEVSYVLRWPEHLKILSDRLAVSTNYYHQQQRQIEHIREAIIQNKRLEALHAELEAAVGEKTEELAGSREEARLKLSKMGQLVRFIKDLAASGTIDDLFKVICSEVKTFHHLSATFLAYSNVEREPRILLFQNGVLMERALSTQWKVAAEIRLDDPESQAYLARECQRPMGRVITVPLLEALGNGPPWRATLYFEHSFSKEEMSHFLTFLTERRGSMTTALERLLVELSLRSTSILWEKTFSRMNDGIAIISRDYTVLRANPAFGTSGMDQVASCYNRKGENSPCRGCPVPKVYSTQAPHQGEIQVSGRLIKVDSYPLRISSGSETFMAVVNHYEDVTSERMLRERVIQGEKMAALGALAGNLAHELNNPLTGIRSLAQILAEENRGEKQLHDDLKEVEKSAIRCQAIIKNFREFSEAKSESEEIDLNVLVGKTLPLLKTALRTINQEIELSSDPLPVWVVPQLLQQVIFNLVNNGCQAIGGDGTLWITTQQSQSSAVLTVRDSGKGIRAEDFGRIFEPFFTTKQEGVGTGLGLSICRSIIERFGGEIKASNHPEGGAQFTVLLPLRCQVPNAGRIQP